jgi:hypothetical protein
MLARLGEVFRKISIVLFPIALLIALRTEIWSDVPVGRGGRLKPPIAEQRRDYLVLLSAAVPGSLWAFVRMARGRQRTFWE